jgi:hypothetical protein
LVFLGEWNGRRGDTSTRWRMNASSPPDICAFGDFGIVFREADPPDVERVGQTNALPKYVHRI